METILKINNISGGYYKHPIINDVSLDIKKGDFLGIIGPNGSGKTTLLRLMSKVLVPDKGNIMFLGKDIKETSLKEFAKGAAFVTQEAMGNSSFTVFEAALLGRIPHIKRMQVETKEDIKITEDSLKMTDVLELKNRKIDELSAGERQRVMIAKALAQEPVLLFLDEPTSHLDIGHQIQIMDLLKKLNQKPLSIVMVMHDLNLASEYCNRIVLLDSGSVFKEGLPSEVLTYQNIEAVYKTVVLVNKNPVSFKPYVILVPGVDER